MFSQFVVLVEEHCYFLIYFIAKVDSLKSDEVYKTLGYQINYATTVGMTIELEDARTSYLSGSTIIYTQHLRIEHANTRKNREKYNSQNSCL